MLVLRQTPEKGRSAMSPLRRISWHEEITRVSCYHREFSMWMLPINRRLEKRRQGFYQIEKSWIKRLLFYRKEIEAWRAAQWDLRERAWTAEYWNSDLSVQTVLITNWIKYGKDKKKTQFLKIVLLFLFPIDHLHLHMKTVL